MIGFIVDHAEIVALELGMLVALATLWAIPATRGFAHRAIRCARLCSRDRTLPLWARYGFVLATLPIPGPFDEITGAIIVLALWRTGHARTVRAHWTSAAHPIPSPSV